MCIFSEAEACKLGQVAGRAASAKFREENADRITKAKARLPDSKFGLIWSSARYVCVKSYVHLLVLMTLCPSSDSSGERSWFAGGADLTLFGTGIGLREAGESIWFVKRVGR